MKARNRIFSFDSAKVGMTEDDLTDRVDGLLEYLHGTGLSPVEAVAVMGLAIQSLATNREALESFAKQLLRSADDHRHLQ